MCFEKKLCQKKVGKKYRASCGISKVKKQSIIDQNARSGSKLPEFHWNQNILRYRTLCSNVVVTVREAEAWDLVFTAASYTS